MKLTNWKSCIEENEVLTSSIDKARAISLIETADARINIIKEINNDNCNFVFEDYYTSLLELLQALTILSGFRVKNHICLGFYLRDVLNREDLFITFNDLRFKRNSLTYYGNRMDFEVCKDAIEKAKKLIKEINAIINKKLKEIK